MARFSRIRSLVALTAAAGGLMGATPTPGAADTAISIDYLYCISLGHGRLECQYEVSGASGTVTYSWSPQPTAGGGSGGLAIVPCNPYQYRTVTLTVTDSGGSDYESGSFYCGNTV